ncbi:MAG TPA: UvrD-helicase domain-containing protein [Chloroflexota bacterium]|nr:UvrD-helicase domain-containing protein [Chloroflexota bacterium]
MEALQKAVGAPLKIAMGDFAATLYMESYRAWRRQELREAVKSPYFARIDFLPDDRQKPETYYVGKTYFADGGVAAPHGGAAGAEGVRRGRAGLIEVTGWQAPVAALFYRATASRASYHAPMGEIAGSVRLKRRFVIEHSQLKHIADDLDERPLTGGGQREIPAGHTRDDLLRQVLSERATPWLRDIIVTLQGDQYALITAPSDRVLLIQGVAGSGKTSIALHRLSYLVYPSLVAAKLPPRCIVFGPNRLFLKYVSAVLPKLGLQHVVQTTIGEWGLGRVGLKKARLVDATFETLLSPKTPAEEKERAARRSRLKTSRRMGEVIERYVERRRSEIAIPEDGWVFELSVQKFPGSLERQKLQRRLDAAALRAAHARHATKPYPLHRAAFLEEALTMVTSLFDAAQTPAEVALQLALGRKRLEQAEELRKEARRVWEQLAGMAPARAPRERSEKLLAPDFSLPTGYGKPPAGRSAPSAGGSRARSGSTLPPRDFRQPPPRGVPPRPGSLPPANEALLQQNVKNIELAAQRRQEEGEALIAKAQSASALALPAEIREQAHKGARAEVKRLMDHYWPPVDPVPDYYALMNDTTLLAALSEGLFDSDEVASIAGSARRDLRAVDAADLPGMHYLFIRSQPPDDMGAVNHDYVVVDEAQDLSELDLICLRALERKHSATFLGDLAQSIYSHRGATSWDHLRGAYDDGTARQNGGVDANDGVARRRDARVTYEECPVSYRTTYEITALANRVLRSLAHIEGRSGGDERLALAFDRHGAAPVVQRAGDARDVPAAVRRTVDALIAEGQRSVAVIAKTPGRARELFDALEEGGLTGAALITQPDYEYEGGVVVVPVALAKGLEFDAAVVVDADAETYSGSAFDGRLLYVALTRAMHALYVVHAGTLTPHLESRLEVLGGVDLP